MSWLCLSHERTNSVFFQHALCHAAVMYCEIKKKNGKRGILCRSVFNESSEDAEMDGVGQETKMFLRGNIMVFCI